MNVHSMMPTNSFTKLIGVALIGLAGLTSLLTLGVWRVEHRLRVAQSPVR